MNIRKITALALISVCIISGCGSAPGNASKTGLFFDTVVSVDIYGSDDAESIAENCMNICGYYEGLFDKNLKTSDISKLGHGLAVPVNEDTLRLIDDSLRYCELTDGLFDITVGALTSLWDFHDPNAAPPHDDKIKEACRNVDYRKVLIDKKNSTVTLPDGFIIDVGGAAKGYIADRIAEYLETCDISGAIINMGGDMRLVGTKPGKEAYTIGIKDPSDRQNILCALYLTDTSVATSGTYERCFVSDGIKYHHILDPKTGYPAHTDISSVTVITENAFDSDCLCTVCIMLGTKKALELIENTDGTEAIIVTDDGTVKMTGGADRYIRR
ncbi:MAG: FAD:protein FMN transferase [Lachnospiraceae bacterium]|nr:FAD:protein FMN transferase [Lachnospiraceae bacterium]